MLVVANLGAYKRAKKMKLLSTQQRLYCTFSLPNKLLKINKKLKNIIAQKFKVLKGVISYWLFGAILESLSKIGLKQLLSQIGSYTFNSLNIILPTQQAVRVGGRGFDPPQQVIHFVGHYTQIFRVLLHNHGLLGRRGI